MWYSKCLFAERNSMHPRHPRPGKYGLTALRLYSVLYRMGMGTDRGIHTVDRTYWSVTLVLYHSMSIPDAKFTRSSQKSHTQPSHDTRTHRRTRRTRSQVRAHHTHDTTHLMRWAQLTDESTVGAPCPPHMRSTVKCRLSWAYACPCPAWRPLAASCSSPPAARSRRACARAT